MDPTLPEAPRWAVRADLKPGATHVRWEHIWHRVSPWQGLRHDSGIEDDQRVLMTNCGEFVPAGAESALFSLPPEILTCQACEKEHGRQQHELARAKIGRRP